MKKFAWLMIVLVIVLAACQPTNPAVPTNPAPTAPVQSDPYPAPAQPQTPAVEVNPAYPEPGDPATAAPASWEDAKNMIITGAVAHSVQVGGDVILTLKDGRVFSTQEPSEGEIARLKEECGFLCTGMSLRSQ
jgi:hypothetical protein